MQTNGEWLGRREFYEILDVFASLILDDGGHEVYP